MKGQELISIRYERIRFTVLIQKEEKRSMRMRKMRFLFLAAVFMFLPVSGVYAVPLDVSTFTAEEGAVILGGGNIPY
jgi:hypothetical protein